MNPVTADGRRQFNSEPIVVFEKEWQNRHDGACEKQMVENLNSKLTKSLLVKLDLIACHCYRRWLEGRLGEFMALYPDLRQLINAFRQEAESWSEWDKSVNDRLMDLGNLLPPKGAGE